VTDFSRGVRQTIIAIFNVFFGDRPEAMPSGHLSVEEISAAVSASRGLAGAGVTPPDAAAH